MQQTTELRVRELEQKLAEDLKAMEEELRRIQHVSGVHASKNVQEKHEILRTGHSDVAAIDKRVKEEVVATHSKVLDMQEELRSKINEVQIRDFSHEANLRQQATVAYLATDCAVEETQHAASLEKVHKERVDQTVKALGDTFPKSSQYDFHFTNKMRSALAVVAGDD